MSRKLRAKPLISIVGTGNLASALAVSLRKAGYTLDQLVVRGGAASMRRARRLARAVGAAPVAIERTQIRAQVWWFCVPDSAIAAAAISLAKSGDWRDKVALHASGALTSDELATLQERGAATASVHPLMTFVAGSRPSLVDVPFAVEGDSQALRVARTIIRDLQARAFPIAKEHKAVYHAWGMFASPLLCALLAATESVAAAAGVSRKSSKARMLPILRQTLANYARLGAAGSFSGPIVRGDVATVQKHLTVLQEIAGARDIYVALARTALRDLPTKNRAALEEVLRE